MYKEHDSICCRRQCHQYVTMVTNKANIDLDSFTGLNRKWFYKYDRIISSGTILKSCMNIKLMVERRLTESILEGVLSYNQTVTYT